MKYIITKDGRIIDLERYENKTTPILKARGFITLIDKLKICDIEVYEKDIIKKSDSIEELCDFYVVYEKGGGFVGDYRIYKDFELAKYSMDDKVSVLYGAILVLGIHGEPILKPVAQMNDKGKLELL